MRTMIRRDPITGLYENVPVPDQKNEMVDTNPSDSVQCNKKSVEKPPRGKP